MNLLKRSVLEKIAEDFQAFCGLPINENREALLKLVKKTVTQGFERKNNESVVELYCGDSKPDIMVGVKEGKIWVNTDIVWKTIFGMYEQEQENAAHKRKYMRDL